MTLTIELPDKLDAALKARASASGTSEAGFASKVLEQFLEPALTPAPEEKAISGESEPRRPLSARIREIWADMPDDVRAKLPADGASQHDHYIYGVPKRDQ
jgi:plasmid stability protein